MANAPKTVRWIGSSKNDLVALPRAVQREIGHALWEVQLGDAPHDAKILKGFGDASVLEIRSNHGGNTYRAVYTVRFAEFVYVLHVFQKKSKKGIKTPPNIIDLIRKRLKKAQQDYEEWNSTNGSSD